MNTYLQPFLRESLNKYSSERKTVPAGKLILSFQLLTPLNPAGPIPLAARSMAWVCGRSLTGGCGSESFRWHIRLCFARGLCIEPIISSPESYRVWCVRVWQQSLGNEALTHAWLLRYSHWTCFNHMSYWGVPVAPFPLFHAIYKSVFEVRTHKLKMMEAKECKRAKNISYSLA